MKNTMKITYSIILIIIIELVMLKFNNVIPYYIPIIVNIFTISYIALLINDFIKIRKAKAKIEELEGNNQRLQSNYDSIRSFKHDFNNIMQAIGGYIAIGDISGLNKMYKSIIKECQEINNIQSINKDVINNPAIYNLINHKYLFIKKYGINFKVDVLIDLQTINTNYYDLCRVLGIFIDNAIEAAKECDEKYMTIKFLYDKMNNRKLIIVENTYKNSLIDIKKIYEKGFSSKKEKLNHGLGLWKVKQIQRKNKNWNIYTSRGKLFKQQIEIYN